METKQLDSYLLDVMDVIEFREYYNTHKNQLVGFALTSFLKALDIPAKFFREQPEETKEELLENREIFVKENSKFFSKYLIVLRSADTNNILNACRMDMKAFDELYKKLTEISSIKKFEHRTFYKDGYVSLIVGSDELKADKDNSVLMLDFPLIPTKPMIAHKAIVTLPKDNSETPVDHVKYLESTEIILIGPNKNFDSIEEAVSSFSNEVEEKETSETKEEKVLMEPEIISILLVETKTLPKNYRDKIEFHIKDYLESTDSFKDLSTSKLEDLVYDFDESLKSYKQVNALRSFDGLKFIEYAKTKNFEELQELL